jgi:hypothetical protein
MIPSPPQQSPTSSEIENVDANVDESLQSLELAMKAADVIRKTLQQSDDPLERSLWVPPGTVPGLSTFVATGLLLSPLRNAILTRASAARSVVTTNARRQTAAAASNETAPPSQSFQNLIDLIITPAMAVISAQIGLVVGTLYGSSHYLQRVVDYDHSQATKMPSMDRRGKHRDVKGNENNNSPCQSLLVLTDASTITKISHYDGKSQDDSGDPVTYEGEYFNPERPSIPPNFYPSWDPRQIVIESLFRAIQHCQKHRKGDR